MDFLHRKLDKSKKISLPQVNEGIMKPGDGLAHEILSGIMTDYHGSTAVRLWDGFSVVTGKPDSRNTLVFRQPGVFKELLLRHDLLRLGEAYLSGGVDVEGDLESIFDIVPWFQKLQLPLRRQLSLAGKTLRLPSAYNRKITQTNRAGRSTHKNCQASIAHHYDVSNNFYQLWLDPEMVYSCAYFKDTDESLADAQHDKLDYICRKLRLKPGQKLLDIGCGWGAMILWAARHYGVKSFGITLSREQYRHAQERIRTEGLQDQVTVELMDYRELPGNVQYDRICSVGMFEHVGIKNFPVYFGTVKRMLKPGGLFLNHGITNDAGWQRTPLTRFINLYVFPDAELACISDVNHAMEQAGFELLDLESLRRHYTLTLRHWIKALESNKSSAINATSETTYRLWRLYMAASAYYFNEGSLNLYQVLAGHARQSLCTPLRRDDIYT